MGMRHGAHSWLAELVWAPDWRRQALANVAVRGRRPAQNPEGCKSIILQPQNLGEKES